MNKFIRRVHRVATILLMMVVTILIVMFIIVALAGIAQVMINNFG